jgi:hypothetical protein
MFEFNGRGERIRTSGPCLPKTRLLSSHVDLWALSLGPTCRMLAHVPVRFTVEGSQRTFGPCPPTTQKGSDNA